MGRGNRAKNGDRRETIFYILGSGIGIAIIVFIAIFMLYGGGNAENDGSKFSTAKVNTLVPNDEVIETEEASISMGKTVNEMENIQKAEEIDTTKITPKKEDKKKTESNKKSTNEKKENTEETVANKTDETAKETTKEKRKRSCFYKTC